MGTNILVAHASDTERAAFYRKTYTHLALGVLAFIALESLLLKVDPLVEFMLSMTQGYLWLLLLGGFMAITWVAQKMTYNTVSPTQQYLGFGLYVLAQALLFVPLIYVAIYFAGGNMSLINQAAILTGGLFVGLTAVVFLTKTDFSFLRSLLTVGFFVAMGVIVAGLIFGFDLGLWFSAAMILLASGSILYSTYTIKNEYATDQYVPAALSLFASLMLLFWYILRLLMSRS
ncbi:Bax inhibitor-1/YccA family protein [Flavobacterium sp. JP2137]|uniref:Bax inhibitor-1/YccA family protein n=1 Tax=Flavobacterium sp. JP2137 TaxID=3414510 RepID=UPI003D2FA1EA